MKTTYIFIAFLFLSFASTKVFSQDYTSIEILDLPQEIARIAVNQTFKDLNLPRMHFWKNDASAESGYYSYNVLMIKNRLKFIVGIEPNKLTVSIIGRQYYSKNQWVNNAMPMNKKKAAKILNPIKKKIIELTSKTNI